MSETNAGGFKKLVNHIIELGNLQVRSMLKRNYVWGASGAPECRQIFGDWQ